ncbi:hypothetical protein [Paraburkholderia sp. EG287A]|uniref:hypothetical protein n=1 Tax=Paraburkholderia sp. EG287A TaxID=3237012 RepID=UPI0034D17D34
MLERAPLSNAIRERLRRDLENIRATAERKQVTLDRWEEADEQREGRAHFELGCWLYYYSTRIYQPDAFQDRVDCSRRIYQAGFTHLNYEFFTVFDFGERHFDTLVEMGDADAVVDALRALVPLDTTGNLAKAFEYNHWPLEAEQAALLV